MSQMGRFKRSTIQSSEPGPFWRFSNSLILFLILSSATIVFWWSLKDCVSFGPTSFSSMKSKSLDTSTTHYQFSANCSKTQRTKLFTVTWSKKVLVAKSWSLLKRYRKLMFHLRFMKTFWISWTIIWLASWHINLKSKTKLAKSQSTLRPSIKKNAWLHTA